MSSSPRRVLLVGHDDATRARLAVRGRLLGFDPVSCITSEEAIRRSEAERPVAVISELVLPGADGLVALAHIERQWPGVNTILLSTVPPGPSAIARARHAVDVILVRRGAWERAVVQAAFPEASPISEGARDLAAALDAPTGDDVAAMIRTGALAPDLEGLALTHFAATQPPQVVLPVLEHAITARSPSEGARAPVYETALVLAEAQGDAGFEVLALIAAAGGAPAALRARAARSLSARFDLSAAAPHLLESLSDPDPLVVLSAGHALLDCARRAPEVGLAVVEDLVAGATLPGALRAEALNHLSEVAPRSQAVAALTRAVQDPDPGMRDLASRLLARHDDLTLEELVARVEGPQVSSTSRREALAQAAAQLPRARAMALLERAQIHPEPSVRALAFELALRHADQGFEDSIARAIRAGPAFTQAALLGAMGLGRRGFGPVRAIALAPDAPPGIRARAIRLLGLRFNAGRVVPVLQQILCSEDPALFGPASLAACQLGRPGWALLRSVLNARASVPARLAALVALERHAPPEYVQVALRRASGDPDPAVRAAAIRGAARRAGAEIGPLLSSLAAAEDPAAPDLFAAAVDGAASLGIAGYVGLASIALSAQVPTSARRLAWSHLEAGFEEEEIDPVRARLSAQALEVLQPARPAAAAAVAPSARGLPDRAVAWDDTGPARTRLPRPGPSGPAVEAWEIEDTSKWRRATGEAEATPRTGSEAGPEAPPQAQPEGPTGPMPPASEAATGPATVADRTRPDPPAAPTRPSPPADPAPRAAPAAEVRAAPDAPAASDVAPRPVASEAPASAAPGATPWPVASEAPGSTAAPGATPRPVASEAPASAAPGATPWPVKSEAPASTASPGAAPWSVQPEAATILPSARVRAPRPRARLIDVRRAREALQSALQLGRGGHRGLRVLAESTRIPNEVRVQAIRHLIADFPDRDITGVLERALSSDEPALQNTALSGVMLRRDVRAGPVAALAVRDDAETATRVRAVRFLASRFPKRETRSTFEAVLESDRASLRKVALECLFTSMRFVQPDQVEAGLVNLLKEHDDVDVRVSAAKALGAFGSEDCVSALRAAAGLFGDGALKEAARAALARIEGRG